VIETLWQWNLLCWKVEAALIVPAVVSFLLWNGPTKVTALNYPCYFHTQRPKSRPEPPPNARTGASGTRIVDAPTQEIWI
jgi:hypothetical protein